MRELIEKMANNNIGSLCLYLNNIKNIEYLNYLNSNIIPGISDKSLSEKLYYFVNKINDILLCDCGKSRSFIGFKNGYRPTCGDKKCFVKKRRETCIEKYGVDNPKKSKEVIEKEKKSIKDKWGGRHYMLNNKVKSKFKLTMIENWGVEWAQQSREVSEKSKETFNKNPNRGKIIGDRVIKYLNKSENEKKLIKDKKIKTIEDNWGSVRDLYKHISSKVKDRSIENFGVNHHLSHPDIIKKRVESYYNTITDKIKCKLPDNIEYLDRVSNYNSTDSLIILKCLYCNLDFNINRQLLVNRLSIGCEICINCNPILSEKSNMELELLKFISDNYIDSIISNTKSIINGELDIYLPDLNLAFEFNELYWHSELHKTRLYHLNKTKECLDKDIKLNHVWEDDWVYKKDIVKSIILNKLGKSNKIWARKCEIKEVNDNKIIRDFLENNHIQGFVGSKVKIGLFYNDRLISLMTFGNLRKSLGQKSEEGSYELLRFCNVLNTSVIGGASKLFKYFLTNYKPSEVTSYSDSSRSTGELYKQLGFKFKHDSVPNYYYIIDDVRNHRFNFRKDKLIREGADPNKTEVEIMNNKGYFRIFDCGAKKWIFTN